MFQCFHEALFGDEMFAGLAHFPGTDERGQAVEKGWCVVSRRGSRVAFASII